MTAITVFTAQIAEVIQLFAAVPTCLARRTLFERIDGIATHA
jgi:hypothetical protein